MDLAGRTALVAGGSRGIGRATVERMAAAGARVAVLARSAAEVERVAAAASGVAIRADAAREEDVAAAADQVREAFGGPPDILVNAAGSFVLSAVAETTVAMFDEQMAANLRAPFLLIRSFLAGMLARGSGHVVTIGSIAGRQPFPHNGAYSASKFGVRGLHEVLAMELRGSGVRTTFIEPAATDTDLWERIDRQRHPGLPERRAMLAAGAVADAVLFAVTRPADVAIRTIILERA